MVMLVKYIQINFKLGTSNNFQGILLNRHY